MGVIAKSDREITLYYNSESQIGKQGYAYSQSSDKKILGVDISKTKVTGTHWVELADNLGLQVHELIDVDHPDFIKQYGKDYLNMEEHDWLKILQHSPKLVNYPILIMGNTYHQLKSGADLKKYLEPNSAGIEDTEKNL